MTGCKPLLNDFQSKVGPKVTFRDNSTGSTKGYGVLTNGTISFSKVAYVDGLKHNLISISQLCDAGYTVSFNKHMGTILDQDGKVVLTAPRNKDVYILDMKSTFSDDSMCFYSKENAKLNWLWHKRLSHLNFKNINKLSKNELVSGLPKMSFSKDKLCSACEKGKQHRASFKTKQCFSVTSAFHLLHMDLFGPVNVSSLGGKKCTLVIVDEFSRYTWVFFLRSNSDATEEIINFVKKMENLNGQLVHMIRSDHGIEFKNSVLEAFCEDKGISQNFSTVKTPEQNGVAERRNQMLIETTRTMLSDGGRKTHY